MTQKEFDNYCKGAIRDMVCCHDSDGNFLMVSDRASHITGYQPSELVGKSAYDFFQVDHSLSEDINAIVLRSGRRRAIKGYKFKKKDGSYIWMDTEVVPIKNNNGDVTDVLSISRDVSDTMLLQLELKKKETLFHEACEAVNIGDWEINFLTEKVTWSKAVYDIHELDYDYVIEATKLANFYQGSTRITMINLFKKVMRDGTPFNVTVPFTTAKGKNIWVRVTGNPIVLHDKIVGVFGIFQNIQQEVQATNLLQSMVKQLTSQNKQLEEFNHLLSHTVRGPVSSLCMLLDSYEDDIDEQEKKEFLKKIKDASQGLSTLLTELVDLVKLVNTKEIETEVNNIAAVVNAVMERLKPEIIKNNALIHVELDAWQDILYPKAYLDSIVYHLMSNALMYTVPQRTPVIGIRTTIINNCQAIVFSDNGSGMDIERHGNKLFKPHKTFDKERHGKGLGLFTVKSQVEAMGGEIKVISKPDKGTTFFITFSKQKHGIDEA